MDEGGIELHLQHCIRQENVTDMGSKEEIKQLVTVKYWNIIVSNHGTKWEHRVMILQMNDDGISVLVKWGTSLKRENVFFNDCRKIDVEETSLRKRKAIDFFAPMVLIALKAQ